MDGAINALKTEFSGLRTGRANVHLLDPIHVEAYGASTPLAQVAAVSAPEPRLLAVQVWDRGVVTAVEKAIRSAGLGVNPIVDGQTIRVPIPPLNEERRKELVKLAHKFAEHARVAVRNVRRDGMETLKQMEKDHKITEDDHRKRSGDIQKLTDEHVKIVDDTLAAKEKETMHV
jgi:ribosome recycling factor